MVLDPAGTMSTVDFSVLCMERQVSLICFLPACCLLSGCMYGFAMQELKKNPIKQMKTKHPTPPPTKIKPKPNQNQPNNKKTKTKPKITPDSRGSHEPEAVRFFSSSFLKVYSHLQEQNQKLELMKSPFTLCEVKAL